MLGASCLYRRASGIYAVRLSVPARLRAAIGKTEIHTSTGTKDWQLAKLLALRVLVHWRQRFMSLDIELLAVPSPLLKGDGHISIPDAAKAIGLEQSSLLTELLAECADLHTQAINWNGIRVADLSLIERDYDGTFIPNDIERQGEAVCLSAQVKAFNTRTTLASLIVNGVSFESAFRLDGNATFWPNGDGLSIPATAWLVPKSTIETIRARLATGILPEHRKPVTAAPIPVAVDPKAKHGATTVSQVLDSYIKHKEVALPQAKRMRSEIGLFIELVGDTALHDLDIDLVDQFRDELLRLPHNTYVAKRRNKADSMKELQAIAAAKGLPTKDAATVKRHISHLSQLLSFAKSRRMITDNPAENYTSGVGKKKKARDQDARDVFTAEELKLIFGQDWFREGKGVFSKTGHTYFQPFHYWLPLLGLLTGARLNELSQLHLKDIRASDNDDFVWIIDISDDTEDKSLKNANSRRIVPMHQTLFDLGLPAYVEKLRNSGYERLFPELPHDPAKHYSDKSSSWFNEKFLGNRLKFERNGKKTFHSFRHTFIDRCKNELKLPEIETARIVGHQRGEKETYAHYGKDSDAVHLKPVIDRIAFNCVKDIARFDTDAGIRALQAALNSRRQKRR